MFTKREMTSEWLHHIAAYKARTDVTSYQRMYRISSFLHVASVQQRVTAKHGCVITAIKLMIHVATKILFKIKQGKRTKTNEPN